MRNRTIFNKLLSVTFLVCLLASAASSLKAQWSAAQQVSSTPKVFTFWQRYCFDSQGYIHFVYKNWDSGQARVYYCHNRTGSWVQTSIADGDTPVIVYTPQDDRLHMIYEINGEIRYRSKLVSDGSWSSYTRIDANPSSGFIHDMVVDNDGGIYFAYGHLFDPNWNPNSGAYGRYKPLGGSWGATEFIQGLTNDIWPQNLRLAVDPTTNRIFASYRLTNTSAGARYKIRSPGASGTWSVERIADNRAYGGTVTVAPNGEVAMVWGEGAEFPQSGTHWQIFARFSGDGGFTWSPRYAVRLNPDLHRSPTACYDRRNNFHVNWEGRISESSNFNTYTRSRIGGIWQPEEIANAGTGVAIGGLQANGNTLYVTFSQKIGEINQVMLKTKNLGTDDTPPGPVLNFNPVGGDKRVTLSWTNPSNSDFMGTVIRYSSTGYPTSPVTGTEVCARAAAPGSNDSFILWPLSASTTYYFSAWAHDTSGNYSLVSQSAATTNADLTPPANPAAFTAVPYTSANLRLQWTNPSDVDFKGTMIRFKTTGYPTSPTDGTLVCNQANSPGSTDSFIHNNLTVGQTYYYRAFSYDYEASPNYSSGAAAEGVPVAQTCAMVRQLPDSSPVSLIGKVVTAVFSEDTAIYISEPDRTSGIRVVNNGSGLAVGDIVSVTANMATRQLNSVNAERQLTSATVTKTGTQTPLVPLSMNGKTFGGAAQGLVAGVKNGTGLNNIGILGRIYGKVSYASGQYIFVDDGSKVENIWGLSTPVTGIMVKGPSSTTAYPVGSLVSAVGIVEGSVPTGWTENRAFLHCRSWGDVILIAPPPVGTLSGVVRDSASNPVSGATVSTSTGGYSATTNASGQYTIANMTPGSYNATASKSGYSSQTLSVNISSYATTTQDFTINPTVGTISGYVRDTSNNAIPGATVATNAGGYTTTSGADGAYTLSNVSPGSYDVTASKTGYDSQTVMGVSVTAGSNTTQNFNLVSNVGTLTGSVKDSSNNAISGATVATSTGGYTTTTNASGLYTIYGITPGTYNVTASKTGYNSQTVNGVSLTAGNTTTQNFNLTPLPGSISGVVRDTSNNPLSGATVSTNTGGYSTTTNASGAYTLSNVTPGTYNVTASKTNYQSQTQNSVSVGPGGAVIQNFNLTPLPGSITGVVRDTSNNPLSGATVSTNTGGYSTTTNASGAYTLSNVAVGTYNVTASKTNYLPQTVNSVVVNPNAATTQNFNLVYDPFREVLINGNFEGGSFSFWGGTIGNNWGACWKDTSSPPNRWAVETVDGSTVQRVRVEGSGYSMGIGQSVSGLTPGAPYTFTASVKRIFDNNGAFIAVIDGIGGVTLPATGTPVPVVTNTWVTSQVTGTVPASGSVTVYVWAWKDNWGSSYNVYFDNLSLITY